MASRYRHGCGWQQSLLGSLPQGLWSEIGNLIMFNNMSRTFLVFLISFIITVAGAAIIYLDKTEMISLSRRAVFLLEPLTLCSFIIACRSIWHHLADLRKLNMRPKKLNFGHPIFGYNRKQVLLYAIFCFVLLGHLLWVAAPKFHLRAPLISADTAERGLISLNKFSGGVHLILSQPVRYNKTTEPKFPFPTVMRRVADFRFELKDSILGTGNNPQEQYRHITCKPIEQSGKTECKLALSLPLKMIFKHPPFEDNTLVGNSDVVKQIFVETDVSQLLVTLANDEGKLKVSANNVFGSTYYMSSGFPNFPRAYRILKPDLPSVFTVQIFDISDKINLGETIQLDQENFRPLVETRNLGTVTLSLSLDKVKANAKLLCSRANIPDLHCPAQPDYATTCATPRTGDRRIICDKYFKSNLWNSRNQQLEFPLDQLADRAFFVAFLRSTGYQIDLRSDEVDYLKTIEEQIIKDYARILGLPEAGDLAWKAKSIKRSLLRQPQLYPYYKDRKKWAPIIMADLEEKLQQMGFPE